MLFAISNNNFVFQLSCNYPIVDDCKPTFLHFVANWVKNLSLCPASTLTKQISHALVTTLRATSRSNTDLLTESTHQFVWRSTFQSDAIKKHFSKSSQTSGRHHLFSLLEVDISAKKINLSIWRIIKILGGRLFTKKNNFQKLKIWNIKFYFSIFSGD